MILLYHILYYLDVEYIVDYEIADMDYCFILPLDAPRHEYW